MNAVLVILTHSCLTPCGELLLGSLHGRLCLCDWQEGKQHAAALALMQRHARTTLEEGSCPILQQAETELREYFAGKRRAFETPLLFIGTPFRQRVWQELLTIPWGETLSYADMAQRLGKPGAMRAVANALGANVLSIFAPCHRVIGSDGSLTGYRGGLGAKRYLLEKENRWRDR